MYYIFSNCTHKYSLNINICHRHLEVFLLYFIWSTKLWVQKPFSFSERKIGLPAFTKGYIPRNLQISKSANNSIIFLKKSTCNNEITKLWYQDGDTGHSNYVFQQKWQMIAPMTKSANSRNSGCQIQDLLHTRIFLQCDRTRHGKVISKVGPLV